MAVQESQSYKEHHGNGFTTSFLTPVFLENADIHATVTIDGVSTALTLDVDYSLEGAGESSGGTLTYPISGLPLAVGDIILIERKMVTEQPVSLSTFGKVSLPVIERMVDRLTLLAQQSELSLSRSVRAASPERPLSALPPVAERAGKALGFGNNGNPIAVDNTAASFTADLQGLPFAQCRLEHFGGAGEFGAIVPWGGNRITINGQSRVIPSAGVPISAGSFYVPESGHQASYVYARWTGFEVESFLERVDQNAPQKNDLGLYNSPNDPDTTLVGLVVVADDGSITYERCSSFYNRRKKTFSKTMWDSIQGDQTESQLDIWLQIDGMSLDIAAWNDTHITASSEVYARTTSSTASVQHRINIGPNANEIVAVDFADPYQSFMLSKIRSYTAQVNGLCTVTPMVQINDGAQTPGVLTISGTYTHARVEWEG